MDLYQRRVLLLLLLIIIIDPLSVQIINKPCVDVNLY